MKALNDIVFSQVKFTKAYLILTFIFVTIVSEVKIIPSIFSKVMLLWGVFISVYTIYNTYKNSRRNLILYLVLLLFVVQGISIVFTHIGSAEIISLIINFFFIFVMGFSFIKDEDKYLKEFRGLLKLFVYTSFVMSVFGFYFLVTKTKMVVNGDVYGYVNVMRFTGLYTNENAQGIVSFISIALSLALIFSKKNISEISLALLNILLQFVILANSKANSAMLAVIVFVAIFIFVYFTNRIFRAIYGIILIAAPLYILRRIVLSGKLVTYLNGRYDLWVTGLKVIKDNVVFGVGNTNLVSSMQKATSVQLEGIEGGGLHNVFLQILATNGIVMFLVFVSILSILYYLGIKATKNIDGSANRVFSCIILCTSISILFINMFEANIIYMVSCISIVFWSLIGFTYRQVSNKGGV